MASSPRQKQEEEKLKGIVRPHSHDVLCGRGNFVNGHVGNEHFRKLVKRHKKDYVSCRKNKKSVYSKMIYDEIRAMKPPGRFLKQDPKTDLWSDIGEKKALDKTRQALREGAPELRKEIVQTAIEGGGAGAVDRGAGDDDDGNTMGDEQVLRDATDRILTLSSLQQQQQRNDNMAMLEATLHIQQQQRQEQILRSLIAPGVNPLAAMGGGVGSLSSASQLLIPQQYHHSGTDSILAAAAQLQAQQSLQQQLVQQQQQQLQQQVLLQRWNQQQQQSSDAQSQLDLLTQLAAAQQNTS